MSLSMSSFSASIYETCNLLLSLFCNIWELIRVLKDRIRRSEEAKFAIGYFFLTGFSLVESDFPGNYDNSPFLKIVMGNETTYPTKEELVAGYKLRELFKQRMIEGLQKRKLNEEQIKQLRT